MQQIPPPQLPWHITDIPVTPTSSVRRGVVPPTAPPFDDERNANGNEAGPAPADGRPAEYREPTAPQAPDRHDADAAPHVAANAWPSQFAQALAEALAGARPAQQLTPWTTEQARRRIRQLGPLLASGQRPKVRRIMTSAPAANVLEMTAVVGFGPRVRVLALRLERAPTADRQGGTRWCCTAIESA